MNELKLYQSIKQVHALPCTDVGFNEYITDLSKTVLLSELNKKTRGCLSVDTSNPQEGYLVIYNKDQPNEYISWCPKAEFEEGNMLLVC